MNIIFCSDPLYPERVDMSYADEAAAAEAAGLGYETVDFERLVREGDAAGAVRRVKAREVSEIAIYRGWMLRVEDYGRLYEALVERGVGLINSPAAYRHCHHLPESYSVIQEWTPRSVWVPLPECLDRDRVAKALAEFGGGAVIVKDYVKSRKHEWAEACFIPSAADEAAAWRVVDRFLELQGEQLAGGLVFRKYVELQKIGTHSRSGMPLTRAYRLFFLDGKLLLQGEYWAEGNYSGDRPPVALFTEIAQRVRSRFFTMDVAQKTDGSWIIVELGDGQVAGLPDTVDVAAFYRALRSWQ